TGGATIPGTNAVPVTIIDDEIGVGFSSPVYIGTETDGAVTLTVNRVGTNGTTSVGYSTTNATAFAGTNYQATTANLVFGPGESLKTFTVPLVRDTRVTGPLSFKVGLFSPTPPAQFLINRSSTVT